MSISGFRAGFTAILGRPNVGKSTIVNAIVGQAVSIVTTKPETTRDTILGIYHGEAGQIALIDTAGISKPKNLLSRISHRKSIGTIDSVDLVLLVTDVFSAFDKDDLYLIKALGTAKPALLVINKVDLIRDKTALLPIMARAAETGIFREIVPLSAVKPDDIKRLIGIVLRLLPEGEPLYPAQQITDKPLEFQIQELIRREVMVNTQQEVPHAVAVLLSEYRASEEDSVPAEISATVYCERPSQKMILIGKNGAMIKKIRIASQRKLKKLVHSPVKLELWVKVFPDWKKDPAILRSLGLN